MRSGTQTPSYRVAKGLLAGMSPDQLVAQGAGPDVVRRLHARQRRNALFISPTLGLVTQTAELAEAIEALAHDQPLPHHITAATASQARRIVRTARHVDGAEPPDKQAATDPIRLEEPAAGPRGASAARDEAERGFVDQLLGMLDGFVQVDVESFYVAVDYQKGAPVKVEFRGGASGSLGAP